MKRENIMYTLLYKIYSGNKLIAPKCVVDTYNKKEKQL